LLHSHKVAVVVPAFKEELLVGETIRAIPDFVDLIVVIDDASPDQTYEKAHQARAELASGADRVRIERLPVNLGVGGAIIHGHKIAIESGCDISVVMAGDNQMDPDYLPALLDPIIQGRADFTKGNRFYSAESLEGMPKYRVIGNAFLTILTKLSTGYWHITDPQNGYTAITTQALAKIPLDRIQERYDFENDLLIWLSITGARVVDINIPAKYGTETSTIKLLPFIYNVLRTLIRGFARRMIWKVAPKKRATRS